jgi:hypothetical protein
MTQAHQIAPGQPDDKIVIPLMVGGRAGHDSDTPLAIGAISVNPLDHALAGSTLTAFIRVVASSSDNSSSVHVLLYNVTDAEEVAGSDQTFTLLALTDKDAALTIGSAAGNLQDTKKIYECRIFLDQPQAVAETVELYSAFLVLQNTVV